MLTMNALTAFVLTIQVTIIHNTLVVLRGKENTYSLTHNARKLMCVSDDDGAGLIWNSNLIWRYDSYAFSDRGGVTNFQNINNVQTKEIDCSLVSYGQCMSLWNFTNWSLTNSIEKPMGPVLDRRWEEFREYSNFYRYDEYHLLDRLNGTGVVVFSVRGLKDAHMLLCESENYAESFCYWIILGGWVNTVSVIRKCAKGVPEPHLYPDSTTECAVSKASYTHEALSTAEWRTFVLTWNENNRNISVYDTKKMLMTYVDVEKGTKSHMERNLFLRSPAPILYRRHTYTFLHTTDSEAVLTSPVLHLTTENICVEMLIGLCAECEMEIALVGVFDDNRYQTLETASGSTTSVDYELPTWRYLKIDKTISSNFLGAVRIKLIPKLTRETRNPLWAVSNVRVCPPVGAVRYGIMEATQDYYNANYYWPTVTCQKLFYDENVVVNSVPDATLNREFDDLSCPEGKVGPYCSINCYRHLENNVDCRGTVICEKDGCTCPPGFIGRSCETYCSIGRYGHDCKDTCGWCNNDNCNFKTGECMTGCDNRKRFNIPPFCKMGIDTLPPPEIDFINETTARVILPVKEEYTEIRSEYVFVIQKAGDDYSHVLGDYRAIYKNTTTLVGYVENLLPGTSYKISCTLRVTSRNNYVFIAGEWQNVTTRCTPSIGFDVEAGQTSLTLVKGTEVEPLYVCPTNWHEFVFQNEDTGVLISKGILPTVPYTFSKLTPYTLYKVAVMKNNVTLFRRVIQTLQAAPSTVMNLNKILTSNSEVTLKWEPPEYLNGIITGYKVLLQVQTYFGCRDLKLSAQRNDDVSTHTTSTTLTIADLHAYAQYSAKIAACTVSCSPEVEVKFTTNATYVPTAVYCNLQFQNNTLTWDLPKDCTTITGPILAKIVIDGLGENVRDYHNMWQTKNNRINLDKSKKVIYGAETYRARIYAVRDYGRQPNDLLYDEHIFTTPAKAPPAVRNLDIVEIDGETMQMHLRWEPPKPPHNGVIQHYVVGKCYTRCQADFIVSPGKRCALWPGFICAEMKLPHQTYKQIAVWAVNVNVSIPGQTFLTVIPRKEMTPNAPENFTAEILDRGVVNLLWSHPWKTGGRVDKFLLNVELIFSNLRRNIPQSQRGMIYNHVVDEYQPEYREQLHLLPSTSYRIYVQAITNTKVYGARKVIELTTPLAIEFEKDLISEVQDKDSTIDLHIPAVLNDTKDSTMTVIVKGPKPCEHYSKLGPELSDLAGIKYYEIAWRVATFPTNEFAGKIFTVGDNKFYNDASNCPLKPAESYVIVVIVQTEQGSMNGQIMVAKTTSIRIGEIPRRHDEAWLIPATIFLVIAVAAIYFYRRRRRGLIKEIILQDEMDPTPNDNAEMKTILSNSKQMLSPPTPSDKESLSRISTPEVSTILVDVNRKEKRSTVVKVKDFEDYVRQAIKSGLLDEQYDTFPRGQTKPWDYGKLPQNKSKNRYGNLIAYDENRVILDKLPNDPYSDYINANYITGYKKEKCYIATQGPKSTTVIDFWRMIWQEETLIICMLANVIEGGKAKCEQYWPDIGKKKKYGDVIVFNAKHNVFADYTFRTLQVTHGEETRKVEHLHYTAWPDHGVPLSTHSVVTYLKKLLATPTGNGPVVVHCSAGVGRTGTIILCDICLRRAAAEGVVDVYAEIESIRNERANMVDNKQQYLLAHLALVECLLSFPTSLPCNEVLPLRIKELKKQLGVQQQRLQNTAWQDEALRPQGLLLSLSERNLAKNRFPELVSAKTSRVYLKRYPPSDEDSDYISAVYVDGVRLQNQYLATQLPLPSTFNDFWRMIAEYKVELVVMLQLPDKTDPTCCPIVPSGEFKPTPYINVRTKETTEFEYYSSQKLALIDNSEKPTREQQVTILSSTEWKPGRNQDPPAVMTLVTLWQAAERISRGNGPTVVLCHDGVTGCGLYLALNFLLERMSVERECDVSLAIRAVRRSRPDFVCTMEHMEYLYDAAITYLEYFETYANFT